MQTETFTDARLMCPKCGYPQYCPCTSCADILPPDHVAQVWQPDGQGITCGCCGLTMNEWAWADLEAEMYDYNKAVQMDTWAQAHPPKIIKAKLVGIIR